MNKMKITQLIILFLIIFCSCKPQGIENQIHPMVDGRNLEWDKLNKKTIELSKDVNLFIFQNESYVWISYDFPKGSFGTLDMIIETEKIINPINLHVSTQLGEWNLGDKENIPKTATSNLWWNNQGWTANNLWANGIDTVSYDTPEFKIKNGDIREIQLSKLRFGRGKWKIKLEINAIKTKEGSFINLEYPENEKYYLIVAT